MDSSFLKNVSVPILLQLRWFKNHKKVLPFFALTILGIIIDSISKWGITTYKIAWQTSGVSVGAVVNPHSAFSFPVSAFILIPLSALLITVMVMMVPRITKPYQQLGLALMVSGGLSNLLERLIFGGVTDIFHTLALATNIADILIVTGGVVLLAGRLVALQRRPGYHS